MEGTKGHSDTLGSRLPTKHRYSRCLRQKNEKAMKKEPKLHIDPDMLGEYDLSNGVRGKYANHIGPQSKVIIDGKPGIRPQSPFLSKLIRRLRNNLARRLNKGSAKQL